MATDTAYTTTPSAAPRLWQVPAFLLGLATVLAVYFTRPYWGNDLAAVERQLRAARQALDQSPADAIQAVKRGMIVLDAAHRFPQLAGEAHFVVGSARLRLADAPGADIASERQQARWHLEQADARGVAEADRPRLQYRLAKAGLLAGADPTAVAAALEKWVDAADDPAEGYGLLAQAYSRLNPPDLGKALEATKQQLTKILPPGDPKLHAQARFRFGELNLQLKNVKEGREALRKIGADSPQELFYASRVLLAQSFEETQEWEPAARNWEQARQNQRLGPAEKGRLLYRLGLCYAQEQRAKEALAAWEETAALGGDEGQAAALRLAEMKFESEPRTAAVDALAAALRLVQRPDDYRNALVPLDEARPLVERAAQLCLAKGDWESAQKVAVLYGRLALPGRDDDLLGKTADAWALALAEQAKQAPPDQQATLDKESRARFVQAGQAYERAAGKVAPGAEQAEWLWRGADRFLRASKLEGAQKLLAQFTQLDGVVVEERLAEAWFKLGTTHHLMQQGAAARTAYQRSLKTNSPYRLRARLELSRLDLVEGRFDEAEQALQENKKALLEASQLDRELHEQTLFALADVAYQRQASVKEELREYGTAQERLRGALEQYADGPGAQRARMMLAVCYRNQAWLKNQALARAPTPAGLSDEERQAYERSKAELLLKAAEQYEKVEAQLAARQRGGARLTDEETVYLKHAAYWGADCYFHMRKYEESVARYGVLALRYQQLPEELIARSQLWQSYLYLNQAEKAAAEMGRLREALEKMPSAAFDGSTEQHHRKFWADWLDKAK